MCVLMFIDWRSGGGGQGGGRGANLLFQLQVLVWKEDLTGEMSV